MRDPIRKRAGIALSCAVILLILASSAFSQEAYTVVDIQVVGNRVATTSLILGSSSLTKGSTLTLTAVEETIKRLYGLGIFADVNVEAENVTGGVKVYIVVKELPRLAGLEFSGNKVLKSTELKEKLKLGVGGYISPYLIFQKKEEIVKLYSDKGYFRAEVTPALTYNADSTDAVLKYSIDERSKVKVASVIMTGNSRVPANDLIKKMRNRKRGFLKSSTFAQEKYEEDLTKVTDEYHKRGFIDAYIISDSTSIDSATNRMTIYLNVYEGPEYYFGNVNFKGDDAIKASQLKRALKFKTGDIFDADQYQKTLYELYTAYQDIGHLHVRIVDEKSTRADSVIDITYDITEGLPSHVNLVNIVGNTKTKDHVIRREISMLPGQVFNRELVIRSARDVMALNYFSNVLPDPIDLPNGDVNLEFKIEEKQTGQISAGAGYNSQDKLVGNVGMGIPNLAGNGQNLSFSVDFGSRLSSFSLSFTEPWLFGRPTSLGAEIFTQNRRWYDDYTEGRQGGSIRLGRRLRWPDNYFRIYGSYGLERNRFFDFSDNFLTLNSYRALYYWDKNQDKVLNTGDTLTGTTRYKELPGSVLGYQQKWLTASRLSFTLSRDSRNLPEFATKGSSIVYTFENTGGFLGGFWHYQRHLLQVSHFLPIIGNIALATKLQYGVVTSPAGDSSILVTDRFSPGGVAFDGIVRGYDDGSLTPDTILTQPAVDSVYLYRDSASAIVHHPGSQDTLIVSSSGQQLARVRGKYMLIANFELQIPLSKQQLYALLFFDAGNSWLHYSDIRLFNAPRAGLYTSAGIGFRIVVPGVGTIGFDFGYPFNTISGQRKGWKPHFQIGTTFR